MARIRSRATVSRGTSRKFVWARHFFAGTMTGDALASDLLSQFETDYGAQLIGCTITRIRGYMYAIASDAETDTLNAFRAGIRVSTGNLDISSGVPDQSPWTDENADWMAWEPFATVNTPSTATADDPLSARLIDVKAQRRLDELGERLLLIHGGAPGAPTITWAYGWDLSIGVKLP